MKQQKINKWLIYIVKEEKKRTKKKNMTFKNDKETSILVTNGFENIIGIIFSDHFSNLTKLKAKSVENKRY